MSDRKPDFWVVKRTIGKQELWRTYIGFSEFQPERSGRAKYYTMTEAVSESKKHSGSKVVPVYCTTRKTNMMRERSSAWVLRRLAEGKVVMVQSVHNGAIFFQRFNAKNGFIEHAIHNTSCWKLDNAGFAVNGRVLCRVARSEEVEK